MLLSKPFLMMEDTCPDRQTPVRNGSQNTTQKIDDWET